MVRLTIRVILISILNKFGSIIEHKLRIYCYSIPPRIMTIMIHRGLSLLEVILPFNLPYSSLAITCTSGGHVEDKRISLR